MDYTESEKKAHVVIYFRFYDQGSKRIIGTRMFLLGLTREVKTALQKKPNSVWPAPEKPMKGLTGIC